MGVDLTDFQFESNLSIQQIRLKSSTPTLVFIMLGISDDIHLPFQDPRATFCNRSWSEFLSKGITVEQIWPDQVQQTLYCAKLFPVVYDETSTGTSFWFQNLQNVSPQIIQKWLLTPRLSLLEIQQFADLEGEFGWRDTLLHQIDLYQLEIVLTRQRDCNLLPTFQRCSISNKRDIFEVLDRVAKSSDIFGLGRILSTIADALAAFAQNEGGLRSGPGRKYVQFLYFF